MSFRSTGSYEPDRNGKCMGFSLAGFDPQALTSLTNEIMPYYNQLYKFRSTGSYEPDPSASMDAASNTGVSIHRLLRAWPTAFEKRKKDKNVSIHRLLRAWPATTFNQPYTLYVSIHRLLRAWPTITDDEIKELTVSIHRLLRAWPHTIFYNVDFNGVSIHRLLRAWPFRQSADLRHGKSFDPQALTSLTNTIGSYLGLFDRFRSTGSYEPDQLR